MCVDPVIFSRHIRRFWNIAIMKTATCIVQRKSGWNDFTYQTASIIVSLIENRGYNMSRYIFSGMRSNIDKGRRNKFLLYPSFIQCLDDPIAMEDFVKSIPEPVAVPIVFKLLLGNLQNQNVIMMRMMMKMIIKMMMKIKIMMKMIMKMVMKMMMIIIVKI